MLAAVNARKMADKTKSAPRDELKSYLESPLEADVEDVVAWWGKHTTHYPVLSSMARDFLAIQGSAAPSERAFSSGSLTDTKQRNRISPALFEAIQILKSAYHNGHISAGDVAEGRFLTMGDSFETFHNEN